MGHLNTTYSTTISESVNGTTKFDFNGYSYESELGVGVEVMNKEKTQVLKAGLSSKNGLRVLMEVGWRSCILGVGLSTDLNSTVPRRSFGVNFSIS